MSQCCDHSATPAPHPKHEHEHEHEASCAHGQDHVAASSVASSSLTLRIEAMDCPTEQNLLEQSLSKLAQVQSLQFDLLRRELKINHSFSSSEPILAAISALGMHAELIAAGATSSLYIAQMDCPTEQQLILNKLSTMPGVGALNFDLLKRILTVEHQSQVLPAIIAAIESLGFSAQTLEGQTQQAAPQASAAASLWPLAVAGGFAALAEVAHFAQWPGLISALCAVLAIGLSGLTTYRKGWIALKNRNLNINALMSIAVTGALLIGQWPEAAMVMVLFALAERIEARSLQRARRAIGGLLDLTPTLATVQQADGSWAERTVAQISAGAVLRVKPGERIALDGVVLAGHSAINQAPITGESLPVEKGPGDHVFAGTINQAGALEFRASGAASDSTLARIIHSVEQAQASKAPTQRFVDQFSKIYTPAVVLVAMLVALFGPLLTGEPWLTWAYRALVLLVVACPCALVISTPVSIVSALTRAARQGILVKGGVYLEQGHQLNWLALDKTGTLTEGKPAQTDCQPWQGADQTVHYALAASLAARSDHPVSQAIAQHAAEQGVQLSTVEGFKALPGRGVQGQIEGRLWYLGNHRLVEELQRCSKDLEEALGVLERQGKTVVVLCDEAGPKLLVAVADRLKANSQQALLELHQLGLQTCLLSGDNPHTVQAIAHEVGIDRAHGNLLPEDKQRLIAQLQAQGQRVGMVGDGINDAPALASAQIGFAMGGMGSDTAIETADVALMDDDLRKLASFIRLSKRTVAILKQNIGLALGVKAVFLLLAASGNASMWLAVFADAGVSLLVVFNGLRLLRG